MRDRLDEFGDVQMAAVTFASVERLAAHRAHLELPFPILGDPDRVLYERFRLGRTSIRHIYNPGTLRLYARLLRQGRRLHRPTEDTRQLGGDFVIGPEGTLIEGFWPRSPDDRPTVDQLVTAVTRAH